MTISSLDLRMIESSKKLFVPTMGNLFTERPVIEILLPRVTSEEMCAFPVTSKSAAGAAVFTPIFPLETKLVSVPVN